MTKELAGKIAFVTGSGRGLGRAMAERLAELGADVAIHDISWTAPSKFGEAAGGKPQPNDALGIPLEDVKALTENNLYGTILVCQTFVPPMVRAGSGSVINIGSAAAHFGVTNGVIYAALKAAVIHYTRCLAKAVQTEGVRINAVSPGATKTARFEATRIVDPKMMDSSKKSLVRYAEPNEIAEAVAFLAGPRSKFMSGQVLRVDGGETVFPG
jgi:2-hydroxycyclohexanecarboxyl-CoA dehydrogenase